MATDVISNLAGSLDAELEKARECLRGVDDDIKKVFGKDASELPIFGRNRHGGGPQQAGGGEQKNNNDAFFGKEYFQSKVRRRDSEFDPEEPAEKRRRGELGGFGRGGGPQRFGGNRQVPFEDEFMQAGRRLASRIVSSGKDKSRDEVIQEQRQDTSGRERNRRMFGALLGTLQRFKQDETKLKEKEDKRAQIEAKLDEAAKIEREVVRGKKQELIKERKIRLTEIKRIEVKRRRLQELEQWEEKTKYLTNFIRTETKPHIFYLPKVMNPITECSLEQSKQYVNEMITHKRKIVLEDLEEYEERSKRYWENRMAGKATRKIDPMDADIEDELQEIMKNDDIDIQLEDVDGDDLTVTVFNDDDSSRHVGTNGTSIKQEMNEGKENISMEERSGEEGDGEVTEETTIEVKVEEAKDEDEMNVSAHSSTSGIQEENTNPEQEDDDNMQQD